MSNRFVAAAKPLPVQLSAVEPSYTLNSLATTNGALIIAGAVSLFGLYATNIGAAVAYIKLYNKATAPVVGTDIPVLIIPVPAAVATVAGKAELLPPLSGYRFPLGLGIAITGLMADSDTTAIAAAQVKLLSTYRVQAL